MGLRFNQLLRAMGGGAPPVTLTFTDTQVSGGYFGYFDLVTTAGRRLWEPHNSGLALMVTGTDASMNAAGGAAAFQVSIDGGAWAAPTLAAGKFQLFAGLSDTKHIVLVCSNNTFPPSNNTSTSGALISVTGANPQAAPAAAVQWHLRDPSSPIIYTHADAPTIGGNYVPTLGTTTAQASVGFGFVGGSQHFMAKGDAVYVFTACPSIFYSVNGGAWTKQNTVRPIAGTTNRRSWQKINTPLDPNTLQSIVITDSPAAPSNTALPTIGVMVTGQGAQIAAPSAKTYVAMFGASQVEGVGASVGSVDVHRLQVPFQNIAAANYGQSGATIVAGNTAFPNIMANIPSGKRQTIILSIGINSADDASFQGDYQTLINTVLAAGYSKVICRGLLQTASNVSKNAKIAAAVAAVADARVVFADVSTWTAATTDTGAPVVVMPDGSHPNDLGYDRMATLVVRDHSALLP